jgi:hypothetical protein
LRKEGIPFEKTKEESEKTEIQISKPMERKFEAMLKQEK